MNKNIIEFFEKHSYVIIENFINKEVAALLYQHTLLSTQRCDWLKDNVREYYDENEDGTFEDYDAPGDYSRYGDPIFDSLLNICTKQTESFTGLELVPTSSYNRLYTTGTSFEHYEDKLNNDISITGCLGYDVSNIDLERYPEWSWPLFVKEEGVQEIPIHLTPGDVMIRRGDEMVCRREPFWGLNQAQFYLYYENKEKELYDGRPFLGLSANFKGADTTRQRRSFFSYNKKQFN